MPVGVSDRDTIQRICTHYDEKTKTTFVKSYHATHPSKPEVSGVVRLVAVDRLCIPIYRRITNLCNTI